MRPIQSANVHKIATAIMSARKGTSKKGKKTSASFGKMKSAIGAKC